jgi:hypothetical protein
MSVETTSPVTPAVKSTVQHVSFVLVIGLAVGALAAVVAFSESAQEVTKDTLRALFGIFSTPFILESTVGLFALFIILAINKHRLEKEGDGWVYMMVQEPDEKGGSPLPKAITQRLQGTVMKDKPEPVDEALTERSMVEGFLELGMAAEARREFDSQNELPDDAMTAALRVRVLASNLDTAQAQEFLATSAARFTSHVGLLSATALEQSNWFRKHMPAHEEHALLWHAEALTLAAKA